MRKPKCGETDDPNVLAHRMVEVTRGLSETPKSERSSLVSQVMAEMGRKGEKIGGKRTPPNDDERRTQSSGVECSRGVQTTIELNRSGH